MVDIHTLNRWPNDRVTTLLRIQHPILLSPMAGIGTVELAAAVSAAGGLGSIGCAGMDVAEVRHELNALRELTSSPVNVNFFCHSEPAPDPTLEHMWRTRLTPYYREFGLDPKITLSSVDLPTFDERYCEVVEAMKPEVVSFHFGLPSSGLLGRVKAPAVAFYRRLRRSQKHAGLKSAASTLSSSKATRPVATVARS